MFHRGREYILIGFQRWGINLFLPLDGGECLSFYSSPLMGEERGGGEIE